jgi:hypothetical protein
MSLYSQFPKANTIQMVPTGIVPTTKYHQVQPDKEWFAEHVQDWQTPSDYFQKVQQGDIIYLQLHRQDSNDTELYIYDCTMQQVAEIGIADFIIYPADSGSVYTRSDGTTVPLAVHTWAFNFAEFELLDGQYYLYCPVKFYVDDEVIATRPWISEPLDVRSEHENTILLEVSNLTNKGDIIWKYTGYGKGAYFPMPKMGGRVEGSIKDITKYTSSDNYFKEQDYEQRNTSSTPWVVKQLYVGDDSGIPPYLIEKLNIYMSSDVVRIDGRRYIKDEGAEWVIGESFSYPLYNAAIDIQDYNRQDSFTDNRGVASLVMEIYAYPFYVYGIFNYQDNGYSFVNYDIRNDADRDAMISSFNSQASYLGYSPEFVLDGTRVYYNNQNDENFTFRADVFTSYIDTNISVLVNGASYSMGLKKARVGIVWGDGSVQKLQNLTSTQSDNRHTYAAIGTYPLRLYQDNSFCDFIGFYGNPQAMAISFTGTFSFSLKEFMMQLAALGNISLSPFAPCRSAIERITFFYCGITQIDNIFAAYPQGGIFTNTYFNWSVLTYMSLRGNGLSSAEVTAYIGDVYTNLRKATVRQLETRQSPAAPLNSPATTQKTDLVNTYGWIITTD